MIVFGVVRKERYQSLCWGAGAGFFVGLHSGKNETESSLLRNKHISKEPYHSFLFSYLLLAFLYLSDRELLHPIIQYLTTKVIGAQ